MADHQESEPITFRYDYEGRNDTGIIEPDANIFQSLTPIKYKSSYEIKDTGPGEPIGKAARFSGGVYTDYTVQANEGTPNDVNLLPSSFYFGSGTKFDGVKVNVTTAGTVIGFYTVVWEYWNGAWVTLPIGTYFGRLDFAYAGICKVIYNQPSDWLTTVIDGYNGYFIRSRMSGGAITVSPLAGQIWLERFADVMFPSGKPRNPIISSNMPKNLPLRDKDLKQVFPAYIKDEIGRSAYDYQVFSEIASNSYVEYRLNRESLFVWLDYTENVDVQFIMKSDLLDMSLDTSNKNFFERLHIVGFRIKNNAINSNSKFQLIAFT
jgi:hypothetical protein